MAAGQLLRLVRVHMHRRSDALHYVWDGCVYVGFMWICMGFMHGGLLYSTKRFVVVLNEKINVDKIKMNAAVNVRFYFCMGID